MAAIVVDGGRVTMIRPTPERLGEWSIDDCCVLHVPAGEALRAAFLAGVEVEVVFWNDDDRSQYRGRVLVVACPDSPGVLGFYLRGVGAPERM